MRIALSDMNAYKELYILLYDSLFKFSCSYVRSREAAEELVSDVFIKLWQIREQLGTVDNLKVYLYCITKNLSLNYLEKSAKRTTTPLEEINLESLTDFKNPEEIFI